jgi:hypothetical protein
MIDARKLELRSVEELVAALQPIRGAAFDDDTALPRLRLIKSNISAVLSFTLCSVQEPAANDPEYRRTVEDLRRQCLMINGMISRIMFRQRWLFAKSTIKEISEVLERYEQMAGAACRMCLVTAPKLRQVLLSSF